MEKGNDLKWISDVEILNDYKSRLTFNDGRQSIFDCLPLIEQCQIFASLREKEIFKCFKLDGYTINWADGTIYIAPEYLYEKSVELTDQSSFYFN